MIPESAWSIDSTGSGGYRSPEALRTHEKAELQGAVEVLQNIIRL